MFAGSRGAVAAGRPDLPGSALGEPAIGFGGDVALIGDDQLARTGRKQAGVFFGYGGQDLTFVGFRMDQGPDDRQPERSRCGQAQKNRECDE
ncbi:hypothetical protein Ate01nite_28520 [Actinoplanes teichomyceticus]|nr:hypothetical protein Ate01nite_28520 [Actinoplanes teichomyceticus]